MTKDTKGKETTVSLLDHKCDEELKAKRGRRRCVCALIAILSILTLLFGLGLFVCFADIMLPFRCYLSAAIDRESHECTEDVLLSLTSNTTRTLGQNEHNVSCEGRTDGSAEECGLRDLSAQELEYVALGERTWETVWEIMHDDNRWQLDQGSSLETGRVFSKTYQGIGSISKLQAYVDFSPRELSDMLVKMIDGVDEWNPLVRRSKILQPVTKNTDIYYMIMEPVIGGIIPSRDYVNVRHWKSRDNITLCAITATEYPDMPALADLERGASKPGGFLFRPVKRRPNKCLLEWVFGTDIGGWYPQFLVDQGIASIMMDFLKYCREEVKRIKRERS